jgi:nucleoid DNA-binding protein
MDIPKYIALFLLKYEFCYLPGIGNLEIKRKPAAYDSSTHQLKPLAYELIYTQAIGSIDDQLANFIANNERVSIAHAANAIRDFTTVSKRQMSEGQEIIIPAIGKFIEDNHNIRFIQDPGLEIAAKAIPFFKTSTRVEEQKQKPISEIYQQTSFKEPKGDEEIVLQQPQVNWGKILMLCLIGAIVIGGAAFLIWYYMNTSKTATDTGAPVEQVDTMMPADTATPAVTAVNNTNTSAAGPAGVTATGNKVILNEYTDSAKAARRLKQLQSYGHPVDLVQKDSLYYIVLPLTAPVANQQQFLDSLSRIFNPKDGVKMMQ